MSTDYFSSPGLSFHQLKDLATVSPRYYQRRHVTKEIADGDRDALRLGRLVHLAVLEPAIFADVPQVPGEHLTPSGGLSTKAATREWQAQLTGRDYGTPDELELCRQLQAAVRGHSLARLILDQSQVEVETRWDRDGVACKAKADIIRAPSREIPGEVWDLKTTRRLDGIVRECREYGYAEQLAWYADAYQVAVGGLIVVEKEPPHRVLIIQFDVDVIAQARERVASWLGLYRACLESGQWPNDPPNAHLITAAELGAA